MPTFNSKTRIKTPREGEIKVLGNQWVSRTLYSQVAQDIALRIPELVGETLYRLQDIYGDDKWAMLGNSWVRRSAGRCFAHMVSTGKFPFRFVQHKRYATKRYLLITD